jgi:hypothetical protein
VSFKELETAGWSEAGPADAYDRVVGRVTAHAIEPLLDAARAGTGTRLLDVATISARGHFQPSHCHGPAYAGPWRERPSITYSRRSGRLRSASARAWGPPEFPSGRSTR